MNQASVSAGSTKRARHLLPATKETKGVGEGVQTSPDSGDRRDGDQSYGHASSSQLQPETNTNQSIASLCTF